MKLNKSSVFATLGIAVLTLFSSCQDEDFGYTAQQIKTSKFAQNFENQYGPIDPDQSWDLTNYMTRTAKYDDEALVDYLLQNGGQTRANGYYNPINETLPESLKGILLDNDGYYHVQENTIKWMRNYLKEGVNNTALGSAFSLRAPNNQIAIIPIYQGFANMDWSLYIRHNGSDTKLWEESKDILVSNDGGTTWDSKGTEYGTSQTVYDKEIKAKPIIVDLGESSVKEFNLYLKVDKGLFKYDDKGNLVGKDSYAFDDAIQLSSMGMMLALPCPLPDNLGTTNGEQNLAMIVGCEDSDLAGSDWDMNDVCFLIVGLPALPNRIDITRKRYMCEDLGNTYDFDFNDIVVDVMDVVTSEYDANTNLFKPSGTSTQIATMKHVCGTLPFRVKVGETWFNWVSDPTDEEKTKTELAEGVDQSDIVNLPTTRAVNWNPEFSRKVTGWDHKTNNIEILVSTETNKNIDVLTDAFEGASGPDVVDEANHIYHIKFADRGEAPLIIATDPTLMWMEEHQNIPESWWKEGAFKPTGSADNDAPADGGHTTDQWQKIPETLVKLDENGNAVIWEAPDDFEGIHDWQNSIMLQTNFLDAAFEGYTVLEIIVDTEKNKAETFYFRKVGQDWSQNVDDAVGDLKIENGKASYTFGADILTKYPLGVALANEKGMDKVFYPTKIIMRIPTSYTLTIGEADNGSVRINPENADNKYPEGTNVTITAAPNPGYHFESWSDGNTSKIRTIKMTSDVTLTPSFAEGESDHLWEGEQTVSGWTPVTFDLELGSKIPAVGDEILIKTSGEADQGFNITLGGVEYKDKYDADKNWAVNTEFIERTSDGYKFKLINQDMVDALVNNSQLNINSNNVTITLMDLAQTIKHTISVEAEANGSVSIQGQSGMTAELIENSSVTIVATPADHYKFVSWTKDGNVVSNNREYNFTVNGTTAGTYTAKFEEAAKCTVTIAPGDNGKISVNGTEYTSAFTATDVYEGTTYSIEAIPNEGYDFDAWTTIGGSASQTITVNSNINTTANFKVKTFTLTLEATNGGMYKVDGGDPVASYTQTYDYNTSVTVEAVSNDSEAYSFNGWEDGVATEERTFTMTENKTAKAKFRSLGEVSLLENPIVETNGYGNNKIISLDVNGKNLDEIWNQGKQTLTIKIKTTASIEFTKIQANSWSTELWSGSKIINGDGSISFSITKDTAMGLEGLTILWNGAQATITFQDVILE